MQVVVDIGIPSPKGLPWYRFAKALEDNHCAADDNAIAAD
jgi:hypothetical protein